jgi:hypothetical protein
MADGSPGSLPGDATREMLTGLLTVDGGEPRDLDRLQPATYGACLNWPPVLCLALLVVSSVLLWFSIRPRKGVAPADDRAEPVS